MIVSSHYKHNTEKCSVTRGSSLHEIYDRRAQTWVGPTIEELATQFNLILKYGFILLIYIGSINFKAPLLTGQKKGSTTSG